MLNGIIAEKMVPKRDKQSVALPKKFFLHKIRRVLLFFYNFYFCANSQQHTKFKQYYPRKETAFETSVIKTLSVKNSSTESWMVGHKDIVVFLQLFLFGRCQYIDMANLEHAKKLSGMFMHFMGCNKIVRSV